MIDVYPDLAGRAFGGSVMAASDEFFADKENLIAPSVPEFHPHTFTPKGQLYDGWETRRRFGRREGHDWVLVRLGAPGIVRSVVVDTAHFLGNFPESCSVEGASLDGYPGVDEVVAADWVELVPRRPLLGGTANTFEVDTPVRVTHVRLSVYPDGGVARLRVHGSPVPDPLDLTGVPADLVAAVNGGAVTSASDGFYSPPSNLLLPGGSRVMADGWETARRRDDGHDWVEVRTACAGVPVVAEVDTTLYRGNSPASVALSGWDGGWFPLLDRTAVQPDTVHRFRLAGARAVRAVRLESHPDGGIARLRLWGVPTAEGLDEVAARWLAALPPARAVEVLTTRAGMSEADARAWDRRALPDGLRAGQANGTP